MKELDQLIRESKEKSKEEKNPEHYISKSRVKLPDAIVLIKIIVKCRTCRKSYSYPNNHLLMRRDKQRLKIKEWLHEYGNLPRELFIVTEESDVCEHCFEPDETIEEIREEETDEESSPLSQGVSKSNSQGTH